MGGLSLLTEHVFTVMCGLPARPNSSVPHWMPTGQVMLDDFHWICPVRYIFAFFRCLHTRIHPTWHPDSVP